MTDNPYAAPQSDVERPTSSGELASRWKRLVAVILDALIVGIITIPVYMVLGVWSSMYQGTMGIGGMILSGLFGIGVWVAINYMPLQKSGQTIGKKALGVQIVDVNTRQIIPAMDVILKRMLPITVVSNIPFLGGLIGLVDSLMIFRNDRRCGHDMIAGTVVVEYAG